MHFNIQRKSQVKINPTDTLAWLDDQIDNNDEEARFQKGGFNLCCLLRIIQFCFVFLLIYGSCIVLKTLFFIPNIVHSTTPQTLSLLEGSPDIPHVKRGELVDPVPTTLLDLTNFTVSQEPDKAICSVDNLLFTIIVHSKPDHFRQRQVIRSTWGSLKLFSDTSDDLKWSTRTIFVLGDPGDNDTFQPLGIRPNVYDLVADENRRYEDILEGSFSDLYHNLRYKHIFGLRFASNNCPNSIFFLKADDDAFIDIPGLYRYLVRTFGPLNNQMRDIIAGNVFPSATKPQREGKWRVSLAEYPWSEYPSYLGGLAYILTPDVARDLYKVAHTNIVPQIWVDDVWVTGLLAQTLNIQPLYMNPRYSYEHKEMREWLNRTLSKPDHPHHPPYTFAHLDPTERDWKILTSSLWKKILFYYKLENQKRDINKNDNSIR